MVDLSGVTTSDGFYAVYLDATNGAVPWHGCRNLDCLLDDLKEVEESVTLILEGIEWGFGPWAERMLGTLAWAAEHSRGKVTIVVRSSRRDTP